MLSLAHSKLLLLVLSTLALSVSAQDDVSAAAKKTGLSFTNASTANLTLGDGPAPIPIDGGLRIIRPITGRTLSGPSLNAKVAGGYAADGFYNGGQQQRPTVALYGTTDDGAGFYIKESGVGNLASWLTRLEIEISGKYVSIKDQFIVANNAADKTKPQIVVSVYKVTGAGCC